MNPHRRRPAGGSVQSLVSEVPTRPFVKAKLCLRHSGYKSLHYFPLGRVDARVHEINPGLATPVTCDTLEAGGESIL